MSLPVVTILPSHLQMSWDFKGHGHDLLQDNILPSLEKGFEMPQNILILRFKSSAMLHHVVSWVVTDILKDHSAFTFSSQQSNDSLLNCHTLLALLDPAYEHNTILPNVSHYLPICTV